MFYYQILPNRYLPTENLTYSSSTQLLVGQMVSISIGTKKAYGIVLKQVDLSQLTFDAAKVKHINEIIPFKLQPQHIGFLFGFAYNTFNKSGEVLDMMLKNLDDFRKTDFEDLQNIYNLQTNTQIANNNVLEQKKAFLPEIKTILDTDIILRIIYLIRSNIYENINQNQKKLIKSSQSGNLIFLIIVPENYHISDFLQKWKTQISTNSQFKFLHQTTSEIFQYSSKTRSTIRRTFLLRQLKNQLPKISIVIGTKSSLFIPFHQLDAIFIADEANNLHIQDQNSVYFDTRDAAFMASQYYRTVLYFVSTLPSIRMHQTYSKTLFEELLINISQKQQNLPQVRYFERGTKEDNFDGIIRLTTEDIQHWDFVEEDQENEAKSEL